MARSIPALFNRHLRAQHWARTQNNNLFQAVDYLHRLAAERLAERLEDTPFPFKKAAVLASAPEPFVEAIQQRPSLEKIEIYDPEAITLEPQSVDLILSGFELHAMDDPLGALIRIRQALRPNGMLLAALFCGESLSELRQAFAVIEPEQATRIAPMAEIRDLGTLLGRSGFALPVADIERLTIWHPSVLHLMHELRGMGETNCLLNAQRPLTCAKIAQMGEIFTEKFSREDGKIRTTVDIGFLTGWRPGPNMPIAKRPGSATRHFSEAFPVKNPGKSD